MIRTCRPFDPARACPLVLLVADRISPEWERLADREHALLAPVGTSPTIERLHTERVEACRRYAVDPGRLFLVGSNDPALAAHLSAASPRQTPEVWPELLAQRKPPPHVAPTRLTVTLTNLRSSKGTVLGALYRTERAFGKPAEAIVASGKPTAEHTAELIFPDLPAGEAAVLLFHDQDDNGKLTTGLFGIPKEGYGASNDPRPRMGPPRWRDCRFAITGASGERVLPILLRYP